MIELPGGNDGHRGIFAQLPIAREVEIDKRRLEPGVVERLELLRRPQRIPALVAHLHIEHEFQLVGAEFLMHRPHHLHVARIFAPAVELDGAEAFLGEAMDLVDIFAGGIEERRARIGGNAVPAGAQIFVERQAGRLGGQVPHQDVDGRMGLGRHGNAAIVELVPQRLPPLGRGADEMGQQRTEGFADRAIEAEFAEGGHARRCPPIRCACAPAGSCWSCIGCACRRPRYSAPSRGRRRRR